jgi:hypothetical protein
MNRDLRDVVLYSFALLGLGYSGWQLWHSMPQVRAAGCQCVTAKECAPSETCFYDPTCSGTPYRGYCGVNS